MCGSIVCAGLLCIVGGSVMCAFLLLWFEMLLGGE